MFTLAWDQPGERLYETGIDRGVFYRPDGVGGYHNGVVWNGLTSVDENQSDQTSSSLYFDGVKTSDVQEAGDFSAQLNAFTYPDEFLEFDGVAPLGGGLFGNDQKPRVFGLCYRTLIGNDLESSDHGYKLHLVYNITAVPNPIDYSTSSSTPTPVDFSWKLTTVPLDVRGYRSTAHIILDSTRISPHVLLQVEDLLYNNNGNPRLPLPEELLGLKSGFIHVIPKPFKSLLPVYAEEGDYAISISDTSAYSFGVGDADRVRSVVVIEGSDLSLLPETALPGDIVYDESTGILYKLGK